MPDFDPEKTVVNFRRVVAQRDQQTTASGRKKIASTIRRLRKEWKDWQGEDSLHEMAFGEPEA